MALCHVLQSGDYYLTAVDAFWLGLIDEVIGVHDLPTLRLFRERADQLADDKDKEQTMPGAKAAGEPKANSSNFLMV